MAMLTNVKMLERATTVKCLIVNEPGITGLALRNKTQYPRRSLFGVLKFLEEEKYILKVRALKDARMFKYYPLN